MKSRNCEVLVLGGGPGGYVAAIRAGQLGLNTVLVEKQAVGGTCLNVGCIPSKALIHVANQFEDLEKASRGMLPGMSVEAPEVDWTGAISWKDGIVERLTGGVGSLLKKAGVTTITGVGRMRDGKACIVETSEGPLLVEARYVVLAPGSEPVELPDLPFGGTVISSTEALALESVPKRLAVVGGGYIGLELGTAFAKLGAAVTVIEATDRLLPQYDAEIANTISRRMTGLGVSIELNSRAIGLADDGVKLRIARGDGTETDLAADRILVTVGRRAKLEGWGRSELGLALQGAFVRIDTQCRTSMTDVFAVGDVTGEPMLAHRAMAQAEVAAEVIAGKRRAFDPAAIPAVCFTDPEVVSVGLDPQAARAAGFDIRTGKFPLSANGRAMSLGSDLGFVRVVARKDNDLVLGIQAAGKDISELASVFALGLEMGARLQDLAATIQAHPTQGEALQEAAHLALGQGLHI